MRAREIQCLACRKTPLTKNEIGVNKKLLGSDVEAFYCMNCLADYLEVTVQDIEDKIEEFKEQGCKLFE